MIRRDISSRHDATARWQLFTQIDHAQLSGRLAARVGNRSFECLGEKAQLAIARHDDGWAERDAEPLIDPQGRPLDVFDSPIDASVRTWALSAERACDVDDYAGLLVSLHGHALSEMSFTHKPKGSRDQFEIIRFQQDEIERQETLRRRLQMRTDLSLRRGIAEESTLPAELLLAFDVRWLQALDAISLSACMTRPFDRTPVLQTAPGATKTRLKIARDQDETTHLWPWPFDEREFDETIRYRDLPADRFASAEEYHAALEAAEWRTLDIHFRPGDD